MTAPPWLNVVDQAIRAAAVHRRLDLADQLERKRAQLLEPTLRVLVIGEPNQGKSQLVNALVNAPVCAVGDDVTTAVTTIVQHAERPSAALLTVGGPPVPVPIEELNDQLAHRSTASAAEVGIPRKLLESGIVLIDTAPIGTTNPAAAAAELAKADVVVLASDATAELTATELALLSQLARLGSDLIIALTKIDLVPRWREVADRNRARLAATGIPATLVSVSATLRLHAAATDDHTLNVESGFTDLVRRLQLQANTKSTLLAPRAAVVAASHTVEALIRSLRADSSGATSATNDAQHRLDELRRRSARCQTMLADEMADLTSDLDYDLRDRARRILREIDRAFDKADPAVGWEQFEEWLTASLTEAADANYSWLIERCQWIADRVASSFPDLCEVPPGSCVPGAGDPLQEIGELEQPGLEQFTLSQKVFTGLRGSYGGLLMFGLATSLTIGLPLINPISLGAGAVFGGKSIKEEGDNRLRRRQAAAKAAAQRHVDDFFLKFGKDCKDAARYIHRGLRDHFTAVANELQEEITETIRRHRDMSRELQNLVALRRLSQAMLSRHTPVSGSKPTTLEITA